MEGVTTAIVGFIFVCLVYPHLVKSRPQFYAALSLVLIVILFDAIGNMSSPDSTGANPLHHVMYVLTALVQILNIIVLVMCVGGLSVKELAGEVTNSVEVMRRGTDKPVLVPLTGEQPKAREDKPEAPPRRPVRPKDDSAIPLD
jgi:hypothetical protein